MSQPASSRFIERVYRRLSGTTPVAWQRSAAWYLRFLALIYLIAFVSLWVQVDGLIGANGILPIQQFLSAVRLQVGSIPWWRVPTLCWFNASDGFLAVQCGAGITLSLLAASGVAQLPAFLLMWVLYLSLTVAGQTFLGYQWDGLLLEAGLLAILLAPTRWRAWKPDWEEPPVIVMWLQRWLAFRLMFLSGVVKLASSDPNWRNLTALTYHYWTQPIPTWTSYYASHWAPGFQKFSALGMFAVELVLPPLMFGPRKLRVAAAAGVIALQLLILATGNYGFFNLLAIVLCIPLIDDALLPRLWPVRGSSPVPPRTPALLIMPRLKPPLLITPRLWVTGLSAVVLLIATSAEFFDRCGLQATVPPTLQEVAQALAPLRSTNAYGLFAIMTTDRPELIVQGSNDGTVWREYSFKWKAGIPNKLPAFCTPHMPRLDWQMWFAALDTQSNSQIINGLVRGILGGSKPVMGLLNGDPFAGRPPQFVRIKLYQYRFTTSAEGAKTGDWWIRTDTGMQTQPFTIGSKRSADDGSGQ